MVSKGVTFKRINNFFFLGGGRGQQIPFKWCDDSKYFIFNIILRHQGNIKTGLGYHTAVVNQL